MSLAVRKSFVSRVVFLGLLALVLWLPIPFGSNRPWAVSLMGLATFGLIGLWALAIFMRPYEIPQAVWDNRWVLLIWGLWLVWIAFQLVPISQLPIELASTSASKLRAAGYSRPISISPEDTYASFLNSLTYFGLYLLVLVTVTTRDRLRLLGFVIVLAGLFQAMYGSLMTLSGVEYTFFEKKVAYLGNATGTFINRNHLAGYLEICSALAVGLVVADIGRMPSGGWRVWTRELIDLFFSRKTRIRIFLIIMVIALVLTRSRMGNVAFFTSLMICGSLYVLLRERRYFPQALMILVSFFVVDLVIVNQWFGLEQVVQRVEQTTVETEVRTYVLPEFMKALPQYWLTGSGLGTFAQAVLPYREVFPKHYYDHAHNDYLEFMIETGVVGMTLLAMLVLATVLHSVRVIFNRHDRLRTGIALASLMAMLSIAIHSMVDFNLQIPANAATLVIVMAMVNSCSANPRRERSKKKLSHRASDLEEFPMSGEQRVGLTSLTVGPN